MQERTSVSRSAAAALLVAALLLPAQAQAANWQDAWSRVGSVVTLGIDLAVVRPLGLVGIVVGAGAFVPVALLTAPNGFDGLQQAQEIFINTPVEFVFQRPIGDL